MLVPLGNSQALARADRALMEMRKGLSLLLATEHHAWSSPMPVGGAEARESAVQPGGNSAQDNAIRIWNVLRLSIVLLVFGFAIAALWETHLEPHSCLQQSISSYFYTPVRSIFTGALISVGISMICLRGSTPPENVFLNLAGVFAPLVALIPTPTGGDPNCASYRGTTAGRVGESGNATLAVFAVCAALIVGGAALVARKNLRRANQGAVVGATGHRHTGDQSTAIAWVQIAGAAVLWGLLLYLFRWQHAFFDATVHYTAAVLMFVCAAVVIGLNTFDKRRPTGVFWGIYLACFCSMVAEAIVIVSVHLLVNWDNHWIFWLECAEITPFAIFWATQTKHLWGKRERPLHSRTGAERAEPDSAGDLAPHPNRDGDLDGATTASPSMRRFQRSGPQASTSTATFAASRSAGYTARP